MQRKFLAALIATAAAAPAFSQAPTAEQMWEMIKQQQAEIAELKAKLEKNDTEIKETRVMADVAVTAVEDIQQSSTAANNQTQLGGYGELHYNNLSRDNGTATKDQIDYHRFVLFINHEFSKDVRLFTELEIEHSLAGDGKPGEVELEQAYIEWDVAKNTRAKAGLFLIPVGLLNETHEPDTFYGVERNNVEGRIIPTTWWEGGLGLSGEFGSGWSYDVAMHSGLFLDGTGAIRSGRQKVAEAKADDFAYTGRLKYTGLPGLELATTVQYQSDLWQSEGPESVDAWLWEAHAVYQSGAFGLRALYAKWNIDSAIETVAPGADKQDGFYIEPSYKVTDELGLFVRYSEWDLTAGSSLDTSISQWDLGLNYWLTPRVVFKADYQNQDADNVNADDGFNLGVGYSF